MSCSPDKENNASDRVVVRDIVIEDIYHEEEHTPPPPPPPLQQLPRPTTLEEWFYLFSEKEKPAKSFVDYSFGYWEHGTDLFVLNVAPVTVEVIDGSPSEEDLSRAIRYYPVFRKEYKGLDWRQVLHKMKSQLKEYSGTERFRKSALANATAVTMKFDDGEEVRLK